LNFFFSCLGSYNAAAGSLARRMLRNGGTVNCDGVTQVCTNTGANTNTGTVGSYISVGGLYGVPSHSLVGTGGEVGSIDDGTQIT
jgi:hypothetical protein